MAKHVHIQEVSTVTWQCDVCGKMFEPVLRRGKRKAPARCVVCGLDLCKSCKRHVHVETGSGNGKIVQYQVNFTKTYCPEHFYQAITPILKALETDDCR